MALIKCKECGKDFSDTANACPHCGYAFREELEKQSLKPEDKRKNKYMAGVLSIFLFWVGAHEFYLGKPSQGAAWIVLFFLALIIPFLLPIVIIWAFVNGIYLMCMSIETFNKKYNLLKQEKKK